MSGCCWTRSPVNQYKYFYWDTENEIFLNCYHNSHINSSSTCVLTPVSNVVWHENDVFGGQKITFVCWVSTVCAGKCPCLNRGRHEIRVAGGCLICALQWWQLLEQCREYLMWTIYYQYFSVTNLRSKITAVLIAKIVKYFYISVQSLINTLLAYLKTFTLYCFTFIKWDVPSTLIWQQLATTRCN